MSQSKKAGHFVWPALLFAVSIGIYVFHDAAFQHFAPQADRNIIGQLSGVVTCYAGAWLLARIIGATLRRSGNGRRKVPKLLHELVTAALFMIATLITVAMLLGQSAGGALAGSGLIIAILGFAIRNVLADVLSGVALGLEAPFRIGDWIEIDGTIRGRVTEIGWRTTRLQTRNDTYMILPNSQVSRQRMTNFSAPRKHYRASIEIVLGHDIPVSEGKKLLAAAAASTDLIMKSPRPDVRALSYDMEGVRFAVRYWVPSFLDDMDCRDVILVAIDTAIRKRGLPPPYSRVKLIDPAQEAG
ncbi:mechanosensitive ion channel family protein [Shinella daejeonensis]|uniref:mechanosensitive ion channel family protein n=1 Tax=Shinella daejeonensis TaxID=659017 RepID=UPI0020C8085A|nr:mechanosensitive ion channel family protein [Shinella daejeonensis]MCP8895160.1 mechanosensitive ion channel family protein [Shinella daejeonensis]